MTTLAVLQPSYLPWLGFFDQVRRTDIFVFYDDVQFDKNGWRNRNRIKTVNGPLWLTVPVRTSGRMGQPINETRIDTASPWQRKHLRAIEQAYVRAPHAGLYLDPLRGLLKEEWKSLADLNIAVAQLMCGWFGLERQMHRSSSLGVVGDRNGRLLGLCRHFGAERYLSGNAAQAYLDVEMFQANGIAVEWQNFQHPSYPQLHGAFEPYLSALDCVLNVGADCTGILQSAAVGKNP